MNSPSAYQLAQFNIGRLRALIDDPLIAGFVAKLEEINALAEASPGFVWRLKTAEGDATSLRPYGDERIAINLSVWETSEDLRAYVYKSAHADVLRQRKSWFERFDGMYYALWWVPRGHLPPIEEAMERLDHLRNNGPSERAFSFTALWSAPKSARLE
jgi:heme-degrading monooxygenase HmoA